MRDDEGCLSEKAKSRIIEPFLPRLQNAESVCQVDGEISHFLIMICGMDTEVPKFNGSTRLPLAVREPRRESIIWH